MTDTPAAIKGTFTKLTAVSTRKVAVLHIEVPIERADAAMHALGGFPDPANPVWVAVARLDPSAAPEADMAQEQTASEKLVSVEYVGDVGPGNATTVVEPEKPKGGRLSQQAAIACNDPRFRSFLTERKGRSANDCEDAALTLKSLCGVSSRAYLDRDEVAAAHWNALSAEYELWLRE